jgi:DNA repair protein RecN (Recombination protein N)
VLKSLHVRNLAVLAGGEVELGAGFNVLTGETGAGKSLVVDSLSLLAGARASSDLVREGADALSVAGVFELPAALGARLAEAGFDLEGDELVVRREIARDGGRNRVFVNDQPATLKLLQEIAPALLRIHGQREELGLLSTELQRQWLDRSGGEEARPLLERVAAAHGEWRRLADRLERLSGDQRLRAERLDLLRFQAREIDEARPEAGEEETLRRDREALRHREAIVRALAGAHGRLFEEEESASERIAEARTGLAAVAGWESAAAEALPELAELGTRLEELGRTLGERLAQLETEPGRLDEIEERLARLERLLRKHGATTTAEVLERRAAIAFELAELEGDESGREELEAATTRAIAVYREAALALSAARGRWGRELAARLERELVDLALGKARLEVALERTRREGSPLALDGVPVELGADGVDLVVFRFQPNPGEPMLPLARIASGGELARVSLALQLAARGEEAAAGPTLIFDEADAGLGGAQGAALGRKLQRLARAGQILAVTHLPQVASWADVHHRVAKKTRQGRTFAEVATLDRAGRVAELARMLSGDRVTPVSQRHAEEMLAGGTRR